MSKLSEPKYSGVYANMAGVMSAMGWSEEKIAKRIKRTCEGVIRKGVKK